MHQLCTELKINNVKNIYVNSEIAVDTQITEPIKL
jgi:hypothetical protein